MSAQTFIEKYGVVLSTTRYQRLVNIVERLEKQLKLRDTRPMSIADIQNEILGLSPEERAKLIDLLWDSLSAPEIKERETAWAAESERRIDAFDAGKLTARDARDVLTDLRNSLRK